MIVIVTGGSSGIGLATVRRLAQSGHQVFAASRNPDRPGLPEGVTPVVLDVSSAESCRKAVEQVVADAGGLDVLVNNAGTGAIGPIEETSDEVAANNFEVNLFGPMRLARMVIPVMRSRGGGRIVNVSSMNDVMAAPFGGWYSASKAALTAASLVLGSEVRAFNIFVTVISPGLFRTKMASELGTREVDPASNYAAALRGMTLQDKDRLEKAGDPDEVAVAIEQALASPEPPARVVVGRDAQSFEKLVRDSTPDQFAQMLGDYVDQLIAAGRAEPSDPAPG